MIAFIGSVFSPYYALARRRGRGDPRNHVALNVALYGPRASRWAMTERGKGSLDARRADLVIGPSNLSWNGATLTFNINEVTAPFPNRLKGVVRVHPTALSQGRFALDAAGAHQWGPIAPRARVEADFESPSLNWAGSGYLDSNAGAHPLEDDFVRWDWSRWPSGGDTLVLYDVKRRVGGRHSLALRYDSQGNVEPFEPPPRAKLAKTGWRIVRDVQSESAAHIMQTLEDTPFYARSVVSGQLLGNSLSGVHESLSLDRFKSPVVQMMLPFRMPRRR
ncbi:MAG: carotenoid 1,2-hydratase [Alphaproteobacteria bacterium]